MSDKSLLKILVIDDDLGILEVIKIILESNGYNVITADDSEDLSQKLLESSPDLVIIDIWMSKQDGLELTKLWKAQELTKNIPIILSSALSDVEKLSREVGADAFLAKPFDIKDLLKIVENILANKR